MKKIYKQTSRALTVLGILLFTATSCGGDEKKETPDESLQGLWRITEEDQIAIDTETSEAAIVDVFYPSDEGVQPYLRINTNTYDRFEVNPTDTLDKETGTYTLANNEITTLASGKPAKTYGYTISGKQLVMIKKDGELEISTFATKVVGDPFLPETPTDSENEGDPDGEAPTGCAIYHDTNAVAGSSLNPLLITPGTPVDGNLIDVEGRNGYESRFYLQVEPFTAFRLHIQEINTGYEDVIEHFEYTTISVNDAFSTDQFIFNTDIEKDAATPMQFDLFSSTSCLYIEFFSYQKEVNFVFMVEDLSVTEE